MAKKNPMGGNGGGSFGRPSPGKDRKAMAAGLKKAALSGAKERKEKAESMKKAAKSGGSGKKRGQRHLASKYCNFNKMGQFTGYKKGAPKGYVYLPGSRYLTSTKNLRLLRNESSDAQAKFVRQNRGAVEKAIETASKAGAFKDFGLGRKVGDFFAADFDLAKGGKQMKNKLEKEFGHHSRMQTKGIRGGYGHAGRRARAHWSFAFGQDGHVR